jgi:hypothetical protein
MNAVVDILEGLGLVALAAVLAIGAVSTARNLQKVGDELVDWSVSESQTPGGRRRWSAGVWGSDKLRDPNARTQAARMYAFGLLVTVATGSLVSLIGGITILASH